jgi:hypothetical protein
VCIDAGALSTLSRFFPNHNTIVQTHTHAHTHRRNLGTAALCKPHCRRVLSTAPKQKTDDPPLDSLTLTPRTHPRAHLSVISVVRITCPPPSQTQGGPLSTPTSATSLLRRTANSLPTVLVLLLGSAGVCTRSDSTRAHYTSRPAQHPHGDP